MPRTLRSLAALALSLGLLSMAIAWQDGANSPTEKIAVLQAPPTYWKGNLHTHSLWSDGDDFPEMIADWYKRHGYHFLTLSDHNVLSEGDRWVDVRPDHHNRPLALAKYLDRFGGAWVERRIKKDDTIEQVRLKPLAEFRSVLEEPGKFLLIPGEEITHQFAKKPVHINAINLRDVIRPSDGDSTAETITANMRAVDLQRKKIGWKTIAFLNHPNFGWGVNAEDMLSEELHYFEVFNGHPDVRNYGDATHAGAERMWDIVLALRLSKQWPIVFGMATDDAHRYHKIGETLANPGRAWIMVKAPYLTAEALVRGIEAGDYYCSTGVVLNDVRKRGKDFSLAIRGEKGVSYKTQFVATLKGAPLTSTPRVDKDNKVLDVTRQYSAEIGKVVAESEALEPSYRLTGNEIYVRARVISTRMHPNPYQKGDVEVAWTQPIVP